MAVDRPVMGDGYGPRPRGPRIRIGIVSRMKIEGSNPLRPAGAGKSKRSPDGVGGFADLLGGGGDTAAAGAGGAPVSGTATLAGLLAVQEDGDSAGHAADRAAARQGEDQLDRLEALRRDLLVGGVSRSRLEALAADSAHRLPTADPRLDAILDDIDLRVQVELAKRGF